MRLSDADLAQLAAIAVSAATEAGQMIACSQPSEIQQKAGGESLASQVVTEIDRQSETIILDVLAPTLERFELGLLTEERDDDGSRLSADYFWSVDPLDGTLPFIEGVPGYAVSIALVDRDGTPRIGVVHDPVEMTVVQAIAGAGAFRDGRRWSIEQQSKGTELAVFADRSFVSSNDHQAVIGALDETARDMGLSGLRLHTSGGAVMNACGVLGRPPACYLKFPKPTGGGSVWDFAATACVFQEFGAIATDMHGGRLDLNRADSTFMHHRGVLFATDEALARRLRALHQSQTLGPADKGG